MSFKGHKHSKKSRRKISLSLIGNTRTLGRKLTDEHKQKISLSSKNRKFSKSRNEKISKAQKGKNNSFHGRKHSKETRRKISSANKGKIHSIIWKKNISNGHKKYWKNLTIKERNIKIKKLMKQFNNIKTKPEKIVHQILKILFFNDYKYVGNGKNVIESLVPDFINIKCKKIIEVFGDYWHTLPKSKQKDYFRFIVYKRNGYKTLVIWEHELKDLDYIAGKISAFGGK